MPSTSGKTVEVKPPPPLAKALAKNASAKARWDGLAPSHRREYATWITDAKKDETRERRVAQAVEMLAAGRKTPMRANDAPAVSSAPIAKKIGVKPGKRAVVLGAPEGHEGSIEGAVAKGRGDVVLAFATDSRALAKVAPKALASLEEGGLLWIAFPKKTSGIPTDLSRDAGWDAMTKAGWQAVSLVAIDEAWSAARFRPRP
jgi:hypothetical protein